MRVLDIGCGLGSISVGLAAAVAPGEFQGIDMEQSQIDVATSVAQEAGLSNALFQVADALDLPFPDDYFDAVHYNAIIVHIPDTSAALAEMYRVLKPGGILGAREPVFHLCFIEPDIGNLGRLYGILFRRDCFQWWPSSDWQRA
jgi:ubiquinone/menaquinone biosynthesis C-methylase UbiE